MHRTQIRVEKGIRFVDGKYQVNIDYTKDNHSESLYLGSFSDIEKARTIRTQAVTLRKQYKSSELSFEDFMKELLYIKSTHESLYAPRCCGIMKKEWSYCPYCGKSLK